MTAPVVLLGITQDAVTTAADALIRAQSTLDQAQAQAATADLDYGNAVNTQARAVEAALRVSALSATPPAAPSSIATLQAARDAAQQAVAQAQAQLSQADLTLTTVVQQATIQPEPPTPETTNG